MALPVIGVPMDEHGVDSCVYMPPGVPVLTAGVGKVGLKNAAIAAAQILAVGDAAVATKLRALSREDREGAAVRRPVVGRLTGDRYGISGSTSSASSASDSCQPR